MENNRRDGIVVGLLVILTYFLIYAFLGNSSILASLGGLPLINCTTGLIRNGFSGAVLSMLTQDFAQTVIVIYIVIFVQNIIPIGRERSIRGVITTILGNVALYLIGMWIVRYVLFTNVMNEIVRTFVSIIAVVISGVGAVFASPLRRIIAQRAMNNYLRDYLMNSRVVHWFADAFFITAVILFLAVAIEMTIGLPVFFASFVAGFPTIITLLIMIVLMYYIIRI